MSTTATTTTSHSHHGLVRDDVTAEVATVPADRPTPPSRSRAWALTGAGAAMAYLAGSVAGGIADPVYDPTKSGDPRAIMTALACSHLAP